MDVLKLVLSPVFHRAARRVLVGRNRNASHPERGRFTTADVNEALRATWIAYERMKAALPAERTVGARLNVRLASLTLCCHRELVHAGTPREEAIGLVGDIGWTIYRWWGIPLALVSRAMTRDPVRRLRICTDAFRRFPFNPPGYEWEDVPTDGEVAFNARRCPAAEFFREQGAADVSLGTWCTYDYPLAELWGGRLERTKTLAAGDDCCDFRWLAKTHIYPFPFPTRVQGGDRCDVDTNSGAPQRTMTEDNDGGDDEQPEHQ